MAKGGQFLHTFKPLYEGDSFSMKVKRGDKEVSIEKVTLLGSQASFESGFLGILPMRDDPDPGVEIRYVYPDSPAAKAGLKEGDRIVEMTGKPVANVGAYTTLLGGLKAGQEIEIKVVRKDKKEETLKITPQASGAR